MKPFLALSENNNYVPESIRSIPGNNSGIYYNGFFLQIDPLIFPKDQSIDIFYIAIYRISCFLNTLPLVSNDPIKILRVTGFTNLYNFKIEPVSSLYMNSIRYNFIYKEKDSRPSIITK